MTYFGDEKFALIAAIFCLGGLVIRWRQWPIKYWLALGSLIIYAGVFGADFQHLLVSLSFSMASFNINFATLRSSGQSTCPFCLWF